MRKVIIAAVSENNIIGLDGKLPWEIPKDLSRFKDLTLDHAVIMGRVTFDSILEKIGKPLPKRRNIILSNNLSISYSHKDVVVCHSLDEAFEEAKKFRDDEVYIAGGEEIYTQTMVVADRLEITRIYKTYEGDAFFPEIDSRIWREAKRQDLFHRDLDYSFITYERK